MNQTDLENKIQFYIENLLAIPAVFANENGSRPELPYLTLNVTLNSKIGTPYYPKASDTGNQNIKYDIDYTVSINGYGKTVLNYMENLRDSFQTQTGMTWSQTEGIALRSEDNITDITALISSEFEKRFLYEVIFGTAHEIVDNPNFVDNITGNGIVDGVNIDF